MMRQLSDSSLAKWIAGIVATLIVAAATAGAVKIDQNGEGLADHESRISVLEATPYVTRDEIERLRNEVGQMIQASTREIKRCMNARARGEVCE
jgi:HAMP domain-containing protein